MPSPSLQKSSHAPSPEASLTVCNDRPVQSDGAFVLYWLQATRRGDDHAALEHALARARALHLPLLVYESLRPDHPHANDRTHTFALESARDTALTLAARGVPHAFFLPRTPDEARGVLARLASRAALVVTDWHPGFIFPAQTAALARKVPCRVEAWDDTCVVPISLLGRADVGARVLRPRVHRLLEHYLRPLPPSPEPLPLPRELELPFTPVSLPQSDLSALVASCAIDHAVPPVTSSPGGSAEARRRLARFVQGPLKDYAERARDFSVRGTSGLSPYLHFGCISPREVALAARASGAPEPAVSAFLEELLVRRALAFVHAHTVPSHQAYASLPAWARETLAKHAGDPRPSRTTLAELDAARSPDPLWNAAQTELRRTGVIHPYVRMLWGKLALTFAPSPQDAFAWLLHLNDRWALDGRDPSTVANVAWCLGLHDHPFPERAIFGKVRSMTSVRAAQKFDADRYRLRAIGD